MADQAILITGIGGIVLGLLTLWYHERKRHFERRQQTRRLEVYVYYGQDPHGEHELLMARVTNPSGVRVAIENIILGRRGRWPWSKPFVIPGTEHFQIFSPRAPFNGLSLEGGASERFCINLNTPRRVLEALTKKDHGRIFVIAAEGSGKAFVGKVDIPPRG